MSFFFISEWKQMAFHIQSTIVISTSSGHYKTCREFSLWLKLYKCTCLKYKSMEDVCSCLIIILCVSVINSEEIMCLIIYSSVKCLQIHQESPIFTPSCKLLPMQIHILSIGTLIYRLLSRKLNQKCYSLVTLPSSPWSIGHFQEGKIVK